MLSVVNFSHLSSLLIGNVWKNSMSPVFIVCCSVLIKRSWSKWDFQLKKEEINYVLALVRNKKKMNMLIWSALFLLTLRIKLLLYMATMAEVPVKLVCTSANSTCAEINVIPSTQTCGHGASHPTLNESISIQLSTFVERPGSRMAATHAT